MQNVNVLLNHKVCKVYKIYRLTLNSRNMSMIYQIYLCRKVSIAPNLVNQFQTLSLISNTLLDILNRLFLALFSFKGCLVARYFIL
jgi:hypothetical protein